MPKKLTLMISSRSDKFRIPDGEGGEISLRDVRTQLKKDIESATFLGGELIDVWINEEALRRYRYSTHPATRPAG